MSLASPGAEQELEQKIFEAHQLFQGGDAARAEARLRVASVAAAHSRLPAVKGRALVLLASMQEDSGAIDDALEVFREAEEALALEPLGERFEAIAGISRCCNATGRSAEAIELLENYLLQLEQSGVFAPAAGMRAYSSLIPCYKKKGMTTQANGAAEKALKYAQHVDDAAQVACMKMNVTWVLIDQGDYSQAIKTIEDAERIYEKLNWSISAARARLNRGVVESEQGSLESAQATLTQALADLGPEGPTKVDRAYALDELGRVERQLGLTAKAIERFREARLLLEPHDLIERAMNARELAMCLTEDKRGEAAKEFLSAIELYEAAGAASESAATARLLARLGRGPEGTERTVRLSEESTDSEEV